MAELCFNTMNRSSYFLGDQDPDLPGQIEAAGRAGFQWIGPDAFTIRAHHRTESALQELADRIHDAGMRTFELPTLLVGEDAAEVQAETATLLPMARILRPEFIQVNVMGRIDDSVLDSLRRAGDAFAELGAKLGIEYLPWLPEIRSLGSARSLLDRARVEGAGVIVDSWHFFFGDDSWEDLAALPLGELSYVQFDDHPRLESDDLLTETVSRRAMPGEGHFELDRFCQEIRSKGFDGVVSCEILSNETRGMDLREFADRVYTTSHTFWS